MARLRTKIDRAAVKQLQALWAQQAMTKPATRVYTCTVCATQFESLRKPPSNWGGRCNPCLRAARLATKRANWHRHKDTYAPKRNNRSAARRVKRKGVRDAEKAEARLKAETAPPPFRQPGAGLPGDVRRAVPVDSGYTRREPRAPVVVWSPGAND